MKDAGLPKDAHHNSVQMNPDFLVTSKKLETLIFSHPRIACSDSSFGKVRSLPMTCILPFGCHQTVRMSVSSFFSSDIPNTL